MEKIMTQDWKEKFLDKFGNIYDISITTEKAGMPVARDVLDFIEFLLAEERKRLGGGCVKIVNERVRWGKNTDPEEVYEAIYKFIEKG